MPVYVGKPYQPYSFLIKKLDDLIIAQDDKGAIRWSGTDAATIIQKAIDTLGTGSGKVLISAGVYTISDTLKVYGGVALVGESVYSLPRGTFLKLADGADVDLVQLTNKPGVAHEYFARLEHLYLQGNKANQTETVHCINIPVNHSDAYISHCMIHQAKGDGIYIQHGYYHHIKNCWIEGNDRHGIHIDGSVSGSAQNNFITNNVMYNNGQSGLYINTAPNQYIVGNRINENKQYGLYGFQSGKLQILGNHIIDNSQEAANTYDDVYFRSCPYSAVVGNNIGGSQGRYALYINWGADMKVVGNHLIAGGTGTYGYTGTVTGHIKRNTGYVTENSGTATIAAGATSVTVSHGLSATPTQVLITPIEDPGDRVWVSTVGSTSFNINIATTQTVDKSFYWLAEV